MDNKYLPGIRSIYGVIESLDPESTDLDTLSHWEKIISGPYLM